MRSIFRVLFCFKATSLLICVEFFPHFNQGFSSWLSCFEVFNKHWKLVYISLLDLIKLKFAFVDDFNFPLRALNLSLEWNCNFIQTWCLVFTYHFQFWLNWIKVGNKLFFLTYGAFKCVLNFLKLILQSYQPLIIDNRWL